MHDALGVGQGAHVRSVLDAYTRDCLALKADTNFARRQVTRVLEQLIAVRERPESLLWDNRRELTCRIQFVHIEPGGRCRTGEWKAYRASFATSA